MNICRVCGDEKTDDEMAPLGKKYRRSSCKKCRNKSCQNSRLKNPKLEMVRAAKGRAKKLNLPFNITVDDFEIPEYCPMLGLKLERGNRGSGNSPSLDKIIPSLGYVKGNVVVISHRANRIKYDATAEELDKVSAWLKSHTV